MLNRLVRHFTTRNRSQRRKNHRRGLRWEHLERRNLLTTFFVDNSPASNSDLPGDNLFSEVQEAVDVAHPGDRVLLATGIFKPFQIRTNRITVQPADESARPIIDGSLNDGDGNVIEVRANNVKITGLTVRNASGFSNIRFSTTLIFGRGIWVGDSTGVQLIGNTIRDNESYGILVEDSSQALVQSNKMQRSGIALGNTENSRVLDNTVIDELDGSGPQLGIQLVDSNHNIVRDNLVKGTSGISLTGSNFNKIRSNSLTGNFNGITLFSDSEITPGAGSNFNEVANNRSIDNRQTGVSVKFSNGNLFTGNFVRGNARAGFIVSDSSGNVLHNNTAVDNGSLRKRFSTPVTFIPFGAGFEIFFGSETAFIGNKAFDNIGEGFRVFGTQTTTFVGNTARGNGTNGFFLEEGSANNDLTRNTSSLNGENGYLLTMSSDNSLTRNVAAANEDDGFQLHMESNNNLLVENQASRNQRHGFRLYIHQEGGNRLLRNTAQRNGRFGFAVIQSSDNLIEGNIARSNGQIGIWLEEGNDNQFLENLAQANGLDGFGLPHFSAAERNARDNVFADNRSINNNGFGFKLGEGIFAFNQFEQNECANNDDGADNQIGTVC